VDRFCNDNVNHDDYKFYEQLEYKSVPTGNHMWYMEMINRLPDSDPPELFGISHYEIDFSESKLFLEIIEKLNHNEEKEIL
jgi:hypothetical protein